MTFRGVRLEASFYPLHEPVHDEPKGIKPPEKMGGFWEWTEKDGPAPYVWADRPTGEHCGWTCVWACAGPGRADQLITPQDWGDVHDMSTPQMLAELDDIASRPSYGHEAHVVIFLPDVGSDEWRARARHAIGAGRGHYSEYTFLQNKPRNIMQILRRPGWKFEEPKAPETPQETTPAALAKAGEGKPPEWMADGH